MRVIESYGPGAFIYTHWMILGFNTVVFVALARIKNLYSKITIFSFFFLWEWGTYDDNGFLWKIFGTVFKERKKTAFIYR